MRSLRVLLTLATATLTACSGGSGGGAGGGGDTPAPVTQPGGSDSSPQESVNSRAYWNEDQGICLHGTEPGYNAEPLGTNAECVDFSDLDLTGRDFSGFNLTGANFQNATLNQVKLDNATLKGLILAGVEIDSPFLLKWLTTGTQPAVVDSTPSSAPDTIADTVANTTPDAVTDEAVTDSVPVSDTVADAEEASEVVADEPDLTPPIIIVDSTQPEAQAPVEAAPEPVLEDTADLASLEQLAKNAEWNKWASQIRLAALGLQRQVSRSLVRINNRGLKEAKGDLSLVKNTSEATKGQGLVDVKVKTVAALKTKITDLIKAIQLESQRYKQDKSLADRIAQINKTLAAFHKKHGRTNGDVRANHQELVKLVTSLEAKHQATQDQITKLKDAKEALRLAVIDHDQKIETLKTSVTNFDKQITQKKAEIQVVKNQIKANKKVKNELLEQQLADLNKSLEDLKKQREQVNSELADLRTNRAQPKKELEDLSGQIQVASQDLSTIANQLKEAQLLEKLSSLVTL